jgi:hypothetical protein
MSGMSFGTCVYVLLDMSIAADLRLAAAGNFAADGGGARPGVARAEARDLESPATPARGGQLSAARAAF